MNESQSSLSQPLLQNDLLIDIRKKPGKGKILGLPFECMDIIFSFLSYNYHPAITTTNEIANLAMTSRAMRLYVQQTCVGELVQAANLYRPTPFQLFCMPLPTYTLIGMSYVISTNVGLGVAASTGALIAATSVNAFEISNANFNSFAKNIPFGSDLIKERDFILGNGTMDDAVFGSIQIAVLFSCFTVVVASISAALVIHSSCSLFAGVRLIILSSLLSDLVVIGSIFLLNNSLYNISNFRFATLFIGSRFSDSETPFVSNYNALFFVSVGAEMLTGITSLLASISSSCSNVVINFSCLRFFKENKIRNQIHKQAMGNIDDQRLDWPQNQEVMGSGMKLN